MTLALFLSCLKIFFCRILDVSFGTVRTMLTVKEKTFFASLLGFCEVFVWYVVVKDAINSTGPVLPIAIAYALGFATGTYIGGVISKKLIKGNVTVQVITSKQDPKLLQTIRDNGFAITVIEANESEYSGKKYLLLANINKKRYNEFTSLIKANDENSFILTNDSKSQVGGYFGK